MYFLLLCPRMERCRRFALRYILLSLVMLAKLISRMSDNFVNTSASWKLRKVDYREANSHHSLLSLGAVNLAPGISYLNQHVHVDLLCRALEVPGVLFRSCISGSA
jgi:hypothetical protein